MSAVRTYALLNDVSVTLLDCCNCGVRFGITEVLESQLRASGNTFHCPHGHPQHFTRGETQQARELREAKARAERAEADAQRQREARAWAEQRAKGANIAAGLAKGKLRRVHERIHAGVCPHCQRTFKQLAAHMKTKHGGGR